MQAAIQRAGGQLPPDLPQPPRFEKTNPNDQPVMYIALTSDTLTDGELYKYATSQVQQRINILPGVSQVQIFGVKSAIRVKADPGALASRNITFDELSTAIRDGTSYAGAGQFDGKNTSFVLRPNGQIADAEGYRNMIIARGKDNTPVYLRDVANVIDTVQDERLSRHFFARGFQSARVGHRHGGFAAGRRERGRGRAFHHRSAAATAPRAARLDQAHPDLRSRAKHRPFGCRTCRSRS